MPEVPFGSTKAEAMAKASDIPTDNHQHALTSDIGTSNLGQDVDSDPEASLARLDTGNTLTSLVSEQVYPPSTAGVLASSSIASTTARHPPPTRHFEAESIEIPDGGYGWVVIAACSIVTFFFIGTSYSWGFFAARLTHDQLSSSSTLAFVGSTTVACIAFLAILNAKLIRLIGSRPTALLGCGLLSLGEVLSGFVTTNVGALFVTTGLIVGVGTSLCFMVVSVVPAQYFKKKRGIANGLVYAGGGIGGAVMSLTIDSLLRTLGPPWTFRIVGFITFAVTMPAAWLIKDRIRLQQMMMVEWKLFKDPRFVLLLFSGIFGTFPLLVPPFFLPLYGITIGLSPGATAGIVAAYQICTAVGRIGFGHLCDRIGPINSLLLALVLTGFSTLAIWPESEQLGPLIVFIILNGASNGGFFSTMPTVVANAFSDFPVAVVMGQIVSGWAGGYLLGPPIAAYLYDAYGGQAGGLHAYKPAIWYAGSMALGSAGFVVGMRMLTKPGVFVRA